MNKIASFLSIFLVFSTSLVAQYQQITDAKELDAVKSVLSETYKKISSIECKYLMEKSVALLEEKTTGEGKIRYRKTNPEELFWSSAKPSESSFLMKNDSIEIKNNNGTQKMPVQNHLIFKEIAQIVKGSAEQESIIDEKNFTADFYRDGNNLIVKMIPKKSRMKTLFKTIEIAMNSNSKNIELINIIDGANNLMTINILDPKIELKN